MVRVSRYLLQMVSMALFLLAMAAFAFLGLVVLAGDGRASQSLGRVWFQHDPFLDLIHTASLPLFGAIVERKINPFLWDPVLVAWLNWPSWVALLAAALVFEGLGLVVLFASLRLRGQFKETEI